MIYYYVIFQYIYIIMIYNKLLIYTQHNIIYNMNIYIYIYIYIYIHHCTFLKRSAFCNPNFLP